jgi:hypothetical protein
MIAKIALAQAGHHLGQRDPDGQDDGDQKGLLGAAVVQQRAVVGQARPGRAARRTWFPAGG